MAPRIGHLERVKRLYGYLSKMKHGIIRVRTAEPDYSDLPDQNFDWAYTVYGNVEEIVPDDIPEPLGKHVTMSHRWVVLGLPSMVLGPCYARWSWDYPWWFWDHAW